MTSILRKSVEKPGGTLYNPSAQTSKFSYRDESGRKFNMPMAGKTGTPQNWSDAWTVGFSTYYTTAVWFGFDKPGNSLGVTLTGSTLAGPVWSDYMREIHQGLPFRDFIRPSTGLIDVTVCAKSGLLKTPGCNEGEATLPFLEGTQPVLFCEIHAGGRGYETIRHVEMDSLFFDTSDVLLNLRMPVLRDEVLLREIQDEQRRSQQSSSSRYQSRPSVTRPSSNPLLNDIIPLPPVPQINLEPEIAIPPPEELPIMAEPEPEPETPLYNPLMD